MGKSTKIGKRTRIGTKTRIGGKSKIGRSSKIGSKTDRAGRTRESLFFEPEYKYLADMVQMDTPENARKSVERLTAEWHSAKTDDKRLRIERAMDVAAKRAAATLLRKNLSDRERKEFKEIAKIYQQGLRDIRGQSGGPPSARGNEQSSQATVAGDSALSPEQMEALRRALMRAGRATIRDVRVHDGKAFLKTAGRTYSEVVIDLKTGEADALYRGDNKIRHSDRLTEIVREELGITDAPLEETSGESVNARCTSLARKIYEEGQREGFEETLKAFQAYCGDHRRLGTTVSGPNPIEMSYDMAGARQLDIIVRLPVGRQDEQTITLLREQGFTERRNLARGGERVFVYTANDQSALQHLMNAGRRLTENGQPIEVEANAPASRVFPIMEQIMGVGGTTSQPRQSRTMYTDGTAKRLFTREGYDSRQDQKYAWATDKALLAIQSGNPSDAVRPVIWATRNAGDWPKWARDLFAKIAEEHGLTVPSEVYDAME